MERRKTVAGNDGMDRAGGRGTKESVFVFDADAGEKNPISSV